MSTDDPARDPELATNEYWRGIMMRARKAHGLNQAELGARVGVSQAMISKIESGESTSSDRILAICRVLSITPPQHFVDDDALAWAELGQKLRSGDTEQYQSARRLLESMAAALEKAQSERETKKDDSETGAETDRPRK